MVSENFLNKRRDAKTNSPMHQPLVVDLKRVSDRTAVQLDHRITMRNTSLLLETNVRNVFPNIQHNFEMLEIFPINLVGSYFYLNMSEWTANRKLKGW